MALSFKSFPESQLRHLSTASASSSTLTLTSKAARGRPFPTVRRQHGPWRRPGWSWSHSESPGSLSGECGRVRYPQPVVSSPVVLELLMGQIIKLKHLIVASSAQPCVQASSAQVLGKQCPGLGVCGGEAVPGAGAGRAWLQQRARQNSIGAGSHHHLRGRVHITGLSPGL